MAKSKPGAGKATKPKKIPAQPAAPQAKSEAATAQAAPKKKATTEKATAPTATPTPKPSSGTGATQNIDLYLEYEHGIAPANELAVTDTSALRAAQAEKLNAIKTTPGFEEILSLTPAAVNLPVPPELLRNANKITEGQKFVLIDFLRSQDEILVNAIYITQASTTSAKTAESLRAYRLLKRTNTQGLYYGLKSWGEYNQQINLDLELAKQGPPSPDSPMQAYH